MKQKKTKTITTPFKLSEKERRILMVLGQGKYVKGLRFLIEFYFLNRIK
jgi:hypothetical protein